MNIPVTIAIFGPAALILTFLIRKSYVKRDELGGPPLIGLCSMLFIWIIGYSVELNTPSDALRLIFIKIQFVAITTVGPFFLLFALRYTRGTHIKKKYIALLFMPPLVSIVLVWTNQYHSLFWSDFSTYTRGGLVLTEWTFAPAFYLHFIYTYVTILTGTGLFVRLILSQNFAYVQQGALIIGGTLTAVGFAAVLPLDLSPVPGFDWSPIAITASAGMYGYAFLRTDFFEYIPAILSTRWGTIVDKTETGIIVTDSNNNIVNANAAAETIVGQTDDDFRNENVFTVFPEKLVEANDTFIEINNRTYKTNSDKITNDENEVIGYTYTLSDITEQEKRRQQLRVINRVLRHNLRNELSVINGQAGLVGSVANDVSEPHANTLDDVQEVLELQTATLSKLSDSARTLNAVMQENEDSYHRIHLSDVVPAVVSDIRDAYGDVSITTDTADVDVAASKQLDAALYEIIENVFEHNPAQTVTAEITTEVDEEQEMVDITVVDDGQGVSEYEIKALEKKKETDLSHGSGLGLWIAEWVANVSGGELLISSDSHGTTVTLTMPKA